MRGNTVFGNLPFAALLVVAGLTGPSCPDPGEPCARPPLPEISVFVTEPRGETAWGFVGTVTAVLPPTDLGIRRYRVRIAGGDERTIGFEAPGDSLPVVEGREYSFRVEIAPGMPSPSAVTVHDQDGLLYAAVADHAPGARVLRDGIAGFSFSTEEAGCPDRGKNPCLDSERNLTFRVSRDGEELRLPQGGTGNLGPYSVTCRSARTVTYSDRCADAGVLEVCWTLRRRS